MFCPAQYEKPSDVTVPDGLEVFTENDDVILANAERRYYNCDFRGCFQVTKRCGHCDHIRSSHSCISRHCLIFRSRSSILKNDAFNLEVLPLHVACLVELKLTTGSLYANILSYIYAKLCYWYLFHFRIVLLGS